MHHFFIEAGDIADGSIFLKEDNYNHAVNVLRLRIGERIMVSDPEGVDYLCSVAEICRSEQEAWLRAAIGETCGDNHELPSEVVLFQCLPKADKMELIIQKAVELGVTSIVPVQSKNCVVKLDDKKAESKIKRWQAIAESAAKQSKRSVVPVVEDVLSFPEAVRRLEGFDIKMIPYEDEKGLTTMCEAIISFVPGRRIGAIIGPEGGFDPLEVSLAKRHGILPVSLGKRILRAETAAISILSLIMIRLEIAAEQGLLMEE